MPFMLAKLRRKKLLALLLLLVCLSLTLARPVIDGACHYSLFAGSQVCLQRQLDDLRWDLFYHMGGNGPWIPKAGVIQWKDESLPKGCTITQAHMLSRHAERFPTTTAGQRHLVLLDKLRHPDVKLHGTLAFVKNWQYFTNPKHPSFEELVRDGRYAGTLQAFNTGKTLRKRYGHLARVTGPTQFWTCDSARDIETAEYFADGFFGLSWKKHGKANLQVIPEDADRAANTLTPGNTCIKYNTDTFSGHDRGLRELEKWRKVFTKPIAERLKMEVDGIILEPGEVFSMMEMCGFEVLARGLSPWCNVFTHEEWLDYEYGRDLLHFYRAGPGNPYAGAMGGLWLNATQDLMSNTTSNDVYFSFVHDGDIVPMLATLQIFDEKQIKQILPSHKRKDNRNWVTSDVVPMSGRVHFDRITCTSEDDRAPRQYVRLSINDGFMRLRGLLPADEVPHAVWLDEFQDFIATRLEMFGTFNEACFIPPHAPDRITFLHQ